MPYISIISSSIRTGRKSHNVALYLRKYLEDHKLAAAEILDLNEYKFPLFEERIGNLDPPPAGVTDFVQKVRKADGIIIVTPEYNGGYPASLKNVIDLLTDEWAYKPVAISTVSNGGFGGSQALISIQFSLWKIKTWTVPAMLRISDIDETFDDLGNPTGVRNFEKTTAGFIRELLWCIEARSRMKDYKR